MTARHNDGVFVVIPAYNEASRLAHVIELVQSHCHNIIVVDDGSRDRTSSIAASAGCFTLRHSLNRGQGAALQTGITFALRKGAKFVVTFDADGQHQISDLAAMLEPVERGECDVTFGNRFRSGTSNVPAVRRAVLHCGRLFTLLTSGLAVGDCHNGYRVFSAEAAAQLALRQDRMAHASELYDQVRSAGLKFIEVPVSIRYTTDTLAKGQRLSNSLSVLFQYIYGKLTR